MVSLLQETFWQALEHFQVCHFPSYLYSRLIIQLKSDLQQDSYSLTVNSWRPLVADEGKRQVTSRVWSVNTALSYPNQYNISHILNSR